MQSRKLKKVELLNLKKVSTHKKLNKKQELRTGVQSSYYTNQPNLLLLVQMYLKY